MFRFLTVLCVLSLMSCASTSENDLSLKRLEPDSVLFSEGRVVDLRGSPSGSWSVVLVEHNLSLHVLIADEASSSYDELLDFRTGKNRGVYADWTDQSVLAVVQANWLTLIRPTAHAGFSVYEVVDEGSWPAAGIRLGLAPIAGQAPPDERPASWRQNRTCSLPPDPSAYRQKTARASPPSGDEARSDDDERNAHLVETSQEALPQNDDGLICDFPFPAM